jgi:hypothetical protein
MHVSPIVDHDIPSEFHTLHELPRDDVWFEDGNIILQTDDALFRVYGGLLASRSSVFKDMLAFPPPPEGNLALDNCPVVRLYDATENVRYFLNAIFDSAYVALSASPSVPMSSVPIINSAHLQLL